MRTKCLFEGLALLAISLTAIAQSTPTQIEQQLAARYPLAQVSPDGADLVSAGLVVTLQKNNLAMNKVQMTPTQNSSPIHNVYENGSLRQTGVMHALSGINSLLSALGGGEAQSRTFSPGDKFFVTKISVLNDGIVLLLMSDPINNARYHGSVRFPYTSIDAAPQAIALIPEVLTSDSPRTTLAVANNL